MKKSNNSDSTPNNEGASQNKNINGQPQLRAGLGNHGAAGTKANPLQSKIEKIRQVIDFLGVAKKSEEDLNAKADLVRLDISDEDRDTMRQAILERFSVYHKQYVEVLIQAYNTHLSESTLDAAIAFCTSPAGEEILAKRAVITAEINPRCFHIHNKAVNEVIDIMDEFDLN